MNGNVISGNLGSGIFISGGSQGQAASGNVITGNLIGVNQNGNTAIANAVSGVVISAASGNLIGGTNFSNPNANTTTLEGNVISGNRLYGAEVANSTGSNTISGNLIGTDVSGRTSTDASGNSLGNTSDGVFLINAPGNTVQRNVIAGNQGNGVQIFGPLSIENEVADNEIGLGTGGESVIANGGNGVYLNNAGNGTVADANTVGPGNVISGNNQSGVLILGTSGNGGANAVVGNFIGTDASGKNATYLNPAGIRVSFGNGGNGVFIYGTPNNTIGGTVAGGAPANLALGASNSNLISNNAQGGISIFSPANTAVASGNVVIGNLIGTDQSGATSTGSDGQPLGNKADGVDIYSGQGNTIGQQNGLNVISGNLANGVLIATLSDVPATSNTLSGNYIGTGSSGSDAIPNGQNGVLVENASNNFIGVPSGGVFARSQVPTLPSNVISGNTQAGIQFIGNSPDNSAQGNYIGVDNAGTGLLGPQGAAPQLYGVFINNLGTTPSGETIADNIIAGSSLSTTTPGSSATGFGIEILGSQLAPGNNVVAGNLIGIAAPNSSNTYISVGNVTGVFIDNSADNTIGGTASAAKNVISDNSQAGVEIFGQFATGNQLLGNFIGTDITGTARPGAAALSTASPSQFYGVYLLGSSGNRIGGLTSTPGTGAGNVISGNQIGVDITGQNSPGQTANQSVPVGQNVVVGDLIGTGFTGLTADPNFEYGVYINNSGFNTVGGTTSSARNVISANGIDGIEIFGGATQASTQSSKTAAQNQSNVIVGNSVGTDLDGRPAFTSATRAHSLTTLDGPTVYLGTQLYGVVVIGSSGNSIGGKVAGAGNLIDGNLDVGVYITRRDFQNTIFAVPANNSVQSNTIANTGIYGVLRYDAIDNLVLLRPKRFANKFKGDPIDLADFITGLTGLPGFGPIPSKFLKPQGKTAKGAHAHRHKLVATKHAHHKARSTARPRVPALLQPGVKTMVVTHRDFP